MVTYFRFDYLCGMLKHQPDSVEDVGTEYQRIFIAIVDSKGALA